MAPARRRSWVRWTKGSLRTVLPWPMVAWCEGLYFAQFGEIELRLVRHLCRPDRESIDVGANVGTYLHAMKRHSRRVVAFEPVPWLAQALEKKFGPKVVVEPLALSHESSTAQLHIPVIDGTPVTGLSSLSQEVAGKTTVHQDIAVQTRPLDEVYDGDAAFIKIDVEGHEESVLEGAHRTLERCRPSVLVEAEERHAPGSVRRVQSFFRRRGYRGYYVFRRRLAPIESFDAGRLQRSEDIADYTLGVSRARFDGYVNNFLFLPPGESQATLHRLQAALR